MSNIEEFRRHKEVQHEIEGFHARPTMVLAGHVVERLDGSVYTTGHVAVDLDDGVEEVVGQTTGPLEFDSAHEIVNGVEHLGLSESVDDGGVEGLIGFVVLALGVEFQDCNG